MFRLGNRDTSACVFWFFLVDVRNNACRVFEPAAEVRSINFTGAYEVISQGGKK